MKKFVPAIIIGLVHVSGDGTATYEVKNLYTNEILRVTKKEMKSLCITVEGNEYVTV